MASELFGLVCDRCDAYNAIDVGECVQCGSPLHAESPPARSPPGPSASALSLPWVTEDEPEAARPAVAPTPPPLPRRAQPAPIPLAPAPAPLQLKPAPIPLAPAPAPLQLTAAPIPLAPAPAPLQLKPAPAPLKLKATDVAAGFHRCPRCGTANPADYRFCGSCGGPLATAPVALTQGTKPLTAGRAAVRVLRGERLGQTLPLGLQSTLGRGACEVSFPRDPYLATLHCTLLFRDGHLLVHDEGGSSGTFVRIRDEEPLAPGDHFSVGDHLFRFTGPLAAPVQAADGTRRLGGPRPPPDAVRIEEIHEGGVPGRVAVRRGPSIVFGRETDCDVSFPGDRFVSSRHCALTLGLGGRPRLGDLGSTNGTFVRLPAGGERELFRGDCLRLGAEVLQLVEG